MKLSEVLKNIPITALRTVADTEITSVCYDSRQVTPGALFVAVEGYTNDGHEFIPSAVASGAAAVLCSKRPSGPCPYILTENTRLALATASANFYGRPADKLTLIGVTGTNGKTTVTTLIKQMLEHSTGKKCGLIGTVGNMIGELRLHSERTTPESADLQALLAQMVAEGCSYAVMEVSSHSLVLDRVAGLRFEVGVFTNITQDHLDFHGTMEAYLEAKCRLVNLSSKTVLNADDPRQSKVLERCGCGALTYGAKNIKADLRADNIRLGSDRVYFEAYYGAERVPMTLGIPGEFSIYNALAAVGCCLALGIDITDVSVALGVCKGVKGRAEVIPTGKKFTVIADYAHTPDALENILKTVKGYAKGRTIAVFGCGGDRDKTKRPIMGRVAGDIADAVFVTSDNPRTEDPGAIIADIVSGMSGASAQVTVIPDRIEAIEAAMRSAGEGDVVVLAGKGHEDYQIIGTEKRHMDEREIVAQILENWVK